MALYAIGDLHLSLGRILLPLTALTFFKFFGTVGAIT